MPSHLSAAKSRTTRPRCKPATLLLNRSHLAGQHCASRNAVLQFTQTITPPTQIRPAMSKVIRLLAYAPASIWIFCLLVTPLARGQTPGDARLPDGTHFTFWEKPLSFSKTYYVDGSSPAADDRGPGRATGLSAVSARLPKFCSQANVWSSRAALTANAYVPPRGGSGPDKMISYEAAPGAVVIVKASEVLRDWQPSGTQQPRRHATRSGGDSFSAYLEARAFRRVVS